jgi:O-antigen ligase
MASERHFRKARKFLINQWIDTGLDLGIITLAIFAFGFFRTMWNALVYARNAPNRFGLFPFVFLIYILIVTMSTQSLIAMFDILWMMYVSLTIGLSRPRTSEAPFPMISVGWNYQPLHDAKS